MLAILKAGGIYVPLDPQPPPPCLAYLIADAGIRCVLGHAATQAGLAAAPLQQLPCLDDPAVQQRVAASPPRAARAMADPDAVAYAIYTSGSTGQPKGVLVAHRSLGRLLGAPLVLGYARDSVMLQSINLAFDASVLETWGPLCCGGQLVLYPGAGLELPALRALIADYRINTLTLPATLLDMWAEQLHGPSGLARIVVGAKPCRPPPSHACMRSARTSSSSITTDRPRTGYSAATTRFRAISACRYR